MFVIKKKYRFEAAHRLTNYDGKCRFIHGHNYVMEVEIASEKLDGKNMVIDFGEIDIIVEDYLKTLDHHLILDSEDKEYLEALLKTRTAISVIEGSPTAENIARDFYGQFDRLIKTKMKDSRIILKSITIEENDNCRATYYE